MGLRWEVNVRPSSVVSDLVRGAVAGAVATWIMGKVTTFLYERENREAREREDAARNGKIAYGVAAEKLARQLGRDLTEEEQAKFGSAIHWGLGIATGALYGVLRRRNDSAALAGGLLFGGVFWLLIDEAANPLLGLTPGPGAFPWQTHARGLAGHLVFGTVAEATLTAMEALEPA